MSVGLTLHNRHRRPVDEVVQVYLSDPVASTVRPVRRLVGFRRVELEPGEALTVRFHVPVDLAAFSDGRGGYLLEPGRIELAVGRSSEDIVTVRGFELTGAPVSLDSHRALMSRSSLHAASPDRGRVGTASEAADVGGTVRP